MSMYKIVITDWLSPYIINNEQVGYNTAEIEIEANSIEEAIEKGRQIEDDHYREIQFES